MGKVISRERTDITVENKLEQAYKLGAHVHSAMSNSLMSNVKQILIRDHGESSPISDAHSPFVLGLIAGPLPNYTIKIMQPNRKSLSHS